MAIVSHQTIEDSAQADGRRHLRYEFIDHLGETYIHGPITVASDFDADADRITKVSKMEVRIKEREEGDIQQSAESGEDVLTLVLNPTYSTSKRIAKKLIRFMMRKKDPYLVIALEPLINYLRANYNAAQLKSFLDISTAQAQKMNARIDTILNNKTDLLSAVDNMEVID